METNNNNNLHIDTNKELSEYDIQALDFMTETNSTLEIEFSHIKESDYQQFKTFKYFVPVFNFELKRGNRSYKGTFTDSIQSIVNRLLETHKDKTLKLGYAYDRITLYFAEEYNKFIDNIKSNKVKLHLPTSYSILACLQKYETGSFDDFCSDFGYSDSKISEYPNILKTYEACNHEYRSLTSLYSDSEMDKLREIQ